MSDEVKVIDYPIYVLSEKKTNKSFNLMNFEALYPHPSSNTTSTSSTSTPTTSAFAEDTLGPGANFVHRKFQTRPKRPQHSDFLIYSPNLKNPKVYIGEESSDSSYMFLAKDGNKFIALPINKTILFKKKLSGLPTLSEEALQSTLDRPLPSKANRLFTRSSSDSTSESGLFTLETADFSVPFDPELDQEMFNQGAEIFDFEERWDDDDENFEFDLQEEEGKKEDVDFWEAAESRQDKKRREEFERLSAGNLGTPTSESEMIAVEKESDLGKRRGGPQAQPPAKKVRLDVHPQAVKGARSRYVPGYVPNEEDIEREIWATKEKKLPKEELQKLFLSCFQSLPPNLRKSNFDLFKSKIKSCTARIKEGETEYFVLKNLEN
ncbi:hypothetical protein RCL1_005455 [Eukaryota sp. TZLM3-RCL]